MPKKRYSVEELEQHVADISYMYTRQAKDMMEIANQYSTTKTNIQTLLDKHEVSVSGSDTVYCPIEKIQRQLERGVKTVHEQFEFECYRYIKVNKCKDNAPGLKLRYDSRVTDGYALRKAIIRTVYYAHYVYIIDSQLSKPMDYLFKEEDRIYL